MKFRTGALCLKQELISKKIKGKFFEFAFEPNIRKSFGYNESELIIIASDKQKAQQAYDLFIAALTLLQSHVVYPIYEMPSVLSYNLTELESELPPYGLNICLYQQQGIYAAAEIAAKASFRLKYKHSILKYLFACSQHSNYLVHLDPFKTSYEKLSRSPLDHIRFSYAILPLYSILEELGLEIRASGKNPSKIKGAWNPTVKADLENRLISAKINLNNKAYWNLRSRPTNIHPTDKLQLIGKASWAKYSVRDSKIEIIDAIAYCSWLRSKILAHKLNNDFLSISVYDVANVNFLIRQILLDIFKYVI